MIEIKEALAMTVKPKTVAQITFQKFFPRYMRLSGLSGSLREACGEPSGVYELSVRRVPLRKSSQQVKLPTEIFFSASDKWRATVSRTQQSVATGQPVLIAVQSVAQSRRLSLMLGDSGVGHQVLKAADNAAEAMTIARAGRSGSVTVATNMAGRGTDIAIDKTAAKCGGLLVIACDINNEMALERGDTVTKGQVVARRQNQVEMAAYRFAQARATSQSEMSAASKSKEFAGRELAWGQRTGQSAVCQPDVC